MKTTPPARSSCFLSFFTFVFMGNLLHDRGSLGIASMAMFSTRGGVGGATPSERRDGRAPHPRFAHLLPASGEKGSGDTMASSALAPRSGERVAEGRVRG